MAVSVGTAGAFVIVRIRVRVSTTGPGVAVSVAKPPAAPQTVNGKVIRVVTVRVSTTVRMRVVVIGSVTMSVLYRGDEGRKLV